MGRPGYTKFRTLPTFRTFQTANIDACLSYGLDWTLDAVPGPACSANDYRPELKPGDLMLKPDGWAIVFARMDGASGRYIHHLHLGQKVERGDGYAIGFLWKIALPKSDPMTGLPRVVFSHDGKS